MRYYFLATAILLTTLTHVVQAQVFADAILGEWSNQQADARFLIFKKDNRYYGKIVWGSGTATKDVNNPNKQLQSRELIGLVILNNFEFNGKDKWQNGTIYDPKNGKTYDCVITLKSSTQINVRGYVGISMFGRTEVWTKLK
jgi:uncharacterized protein (DUF2147 family)